jgi:hypothetical protein
MRKGHSKNYLTIRNHQQLKINVFSGKLPTENPNEDACSVCNQQAVPMTTLS